MKALVFTAAAFLLTLLFYGPSQPAVAANSAPPSVVCSQSGHVINVRLLDPALMRRVTVLRPDGGMVFISSPKIKSDYREQGPRAGDLRLDIASQKGEQMAEDGETHARIVFDDPGTYTLLFSDGTTAQESTANYSCKVTISADRRVTLGAAAAPNSCAAVAQPLAACRSSGSCTDKGAGYCCSYSSKESPCYCNNCCVAAKRASK